MEKASTKLTLMVILLITASCMLIPSFLSHSPPLFYFILFHDSNNKYYFTGMPFLDLPGTEAITVLPVNCKNDRDCKQLHCPRQSIAFCCDDPGNPVCPKGICACP